MRSFRAAAVVLMALVVFAAPAYACPTATITGSFGDGCRDFAAHASKDISHVELHYADGRVVKKERINRRSFSINGGVGSEIDVAIVKAGVTRKTFACDAGGSAPVAVLEIRMSPGCRIHTSSTGEPFYWCLSETTNAARTVFVDPGDLKIDMGCLPTEPLCFAITVRGTGSTDPDGDIASWSIAFDDGGFAAGGWAAAPPDDVTHAYAASTLPCETTYCHITLTVTDSQGHTDTDSVDLAFFDTSPD